MTTMKRIYNYIAVSAVAALGLTACNETIVVDKVDEGAYANVVNLVGTLRDANTTARKILRLAARVGGGA